MPRQIRPRIIQLEVSSHCQLRCPACPTTLGTIHPAVGSGFLQPDDFARLLDANPAIRLVELSNNGEIFLNPRLLEVLRIASARGVAVQAMNGANLNSVRDEVLEGVVKYGLTTITCSIDGASQETYQRYRVRGNFERVMNNVRRLNHWKRHYGSDRPLLRWQFVVFGHNEHELDTARRMAEELGMAFVPKLSWDEELSPPRDPAKVREATGGHASRREFRAETGSDYMGGICHQLWDSPQINWDGRVLGCCRNTWAEFGGNAFRDGLTASINGETMTHARQMLLGRAPPRDDVPCTTCLIYQGMHETGRYLKRDDAAGGQQFTLEEALELATEWEASGRRDDAASVYRRILAALPGHAEAARRLGMLGEAVSAPVRVEMAGSGSIGARP